MSWIKMLSFSSSPICDFSQVQFPIYNLPINVSTSKKYQNSISIDTQRFCLLSDNDDAKYYDQSVMTPTATFGNNSEIIP